MSDAILWILVFVGIWPLLLFAVVKISNVISTVNESRATKRGSTQG